MIHRIDVRSKDSDAAGQSIGRQIAELGIDAGEVSTSRIFLIDADADRSQLQRAASELLADPIVETADIVESPIDDGDRSRIEIHLKPGVMDPVAASTEMALRDLGIAARSVRTGRAVVLGRKLPDETLRRIANRVLANGVIESVHFQTVLPERFESGREYRFELKHVPLRQLNDSQLTKLSREGHLFLSLAEMKRIQAYFREQRREPTDIELETLAQTWSEHCVHKTLKSAVDVEVRNFTGKAIGSRRYENLIKETIFQSTRELIETGGKKDFCLSVFVDNAGVIAFDDEDAICFKAETHNHPSAIEPYGGSATGIGGVIRDVLGTGLGAKPVANTDVFCVAFPTATTLPAGVIHPKRVLQQIVAGVRDYGNRMGIPTVNGAVYFDDRYLGNPLVFCGCVGLIPRDCLKKQANPEDVIVLVGGRTGRDGVHGATFSSAELTDTHADEFSHAVQIGNAITEKKMADVILQARDRNLFSAITDCGAGGLSSAVGEMGEKIGASVELDKVPLKYAGLRYDEIWISEAQERMVLAVPAHHVQELQNLAASEDVEANVIGIFGTTEQELVLNYRGQQVGQISMHFLHDGIPMPTRKAVVVDSPPAASVIHQSSIINHQSDFRTTLLSALSHPNIASKHWIIRQYDHEVQGGSVVKPLVGPKQIGPSDAAVIRPKLSSYRGIAIGCGMAPHIPDPYRMAIGSIDEAIRNIICVGADYDRIAILDNFCWPSVEDEITLGTLVRACEACRDAARAYGIPFISGKDSLHNQFTNQETKEVIRIPNTLLISAIGVVEDVRKCVTMNFKSPGSLVYLIATNDPADLKSLAATHRAMAKFIAAGHAAAVHDISDGGLAVAAAEMCIASGFGLNLDPAVLERYDPFAETAGRYLVEMRGGQTDTKKYFPPTADLVQIGIVQKDQRMMSLTVEEMTAAWRGTLDW